MSAGRYSLWMCFAEPMAQRLSARIEALSQISGGPVFEPHFTLVGDIDLTKQQVIDLGASLAPALEGCDCHFEGIGFGETYFQSVFVKLALTPTCAHLRQSILTNLGLSSDYPPHVSLAYGLEDRAAVAAELGGIDADLSGAHAQFSHLVVMASSQDRPVDTWTRLHDFPLT